MSSIRENREQILERYEQNRAATVARWRGLFDREAAGSHYRPYRANMGFSLNDYPKPFDYTIVEFSSRPTLEITNGEIFIVGELSHDSKTT